MEAVEIGCAKVSFDFAACTHTHTHLLTAKAQRPFPAVTVFAGISHSGVEWLLEGSGSGDAVTIIQWEGQANPL